MTFVTHLTRTINPRSSLLAATIWLVATLAAGFAAAASYWAGNVAEQIVVQQHVRRLALETEQLASDLGQAAGSRVGAVRGVMDQSRASEFFARLTRAYPDLDWLWFEPLDGERSGQPWFRGAAHGPWLGVIPRADKSAQTPTFGDIALPVLDDQGSQVGVVAARLGWHWATVDIDRLSTTLNAHGSAQTAVLDRDDVVLVGPATLIGHRWPGVALHEPPPIDPSDKTRGGVPRFERLPDGSTFLVSRAPVLLYGDLASPGWQIQLSEPVSDVYARANALKMRILWISVSLATAVGLVGAFGVRQLIERLQRLTRSAVAVGRSETAQIDVPEGSDEVAQLGWAFAKVLNELQRDRAALKALSEGLERRVESRTREVERLADESRYSAVVRERLKIARDLHDTLAHSMMAILSEIRLLRKLHAARPEALAEELERAESVAHEGLNEARSAIAQMRVNAVRDTGLGAALKGEFFRFLDRTGLAGEFQADPDASGFGDERAETLYRMAEEVLRNVEKHASAQQISLKLHVTPDAYIELRITDDGIGFRADVQYPGHFGLVGLREQAHIIDADMHIESAEGSGTTVAVRLRLTPEHLCLDVRNVR